MKVLLAAAFGGMIGVGGGCAVAQEVPQPAHPAVVVELFTSQGCSSCPPADAFLADLAQVDGVIALALHVDYWDYIGWKDSFSQPAFTERQKAYARAVHSRMVYTPQMVVNGAQAAEGTDPEQVVGLIGAARQAPRPVRLSLSRRGGEITIRAQADAPLATPAEVQVLRYVPEAVVDIGAGENAGRRILYRNVVTDITRLADWGGQNPLELRTPAPGDAPVVVVVQVQGPGAILAAARLGDGD